MKKNRTMRVAVLMLALSLITCCFVGSTFAKYTSQFDTDGDSARVAKWDFSLGDAAKIGDTFTFNLFDVVYDLDNDNNVSANVDADIEDAQVLIAPGCGGSVSVTLTNKSEVNAEYSVQFIADEKDVTVLEWSLDNETWKPTAAELNITDEAIAMANDADTDTAVISLYYRWVFGDDANNASDTTLGLAGTSMPTIDVVVTVEQVD